jgi:hypothetical protein
LQLPSALQTLAGHIDFKSSGQVAFAVGQIMTEIVVNTTMEIALFIGSLCGWDWARAKG